mgnify:CR=1 FL=1
MEHAELHAVYVISVAAELAGDTGTASGKKFLERARVLNAKAHEQMAREIIAETLAAFEHAMASPNPVEADLYRNVYAS